MVRGIHKWRPVWGPSTNDTLASINDLWLVMWQQIEKMHPYAWKVNAPRENNSHAHFPFLERTFLSSIWTVQPCYARLDIIPSWFQSWKVKGSPAFHYCNSLSTMEEYIQSCSFEIEPGPRYEVNLRVFSIAYHSLKMQLRSWYLLSKKIKTGGFQKCKVHCCNFKDLKVTSVPS